MAYLVIDGVQVRVAMNTGHVSYEPVGDQFRAFSGRLRSAVRGYAKVRRFTTWPMPATEWATFEAVLMAGDVVPCYGDAIGVDSGSPIDVIVRPIEVRIVGAADGLRRVVDFEVHAVDATPVTG